MSIFGNEVQCVLSYVVMENIIFSTLPTLLGCFPVSDVGFFIVMVECAFVHSCSLYCEIYYINGLTVNVYVPSYCNDVKKCYYCTL